jgi:hypothetical protein
VWLFCAGIFGYLDFQARRSLDSYGVILFDGVRFQVPFPAAFAFFGTGLQNQEHVSMVALDAVVAAHRELEEQEHEEIMTLPSRGVNICGIAKSAFHGSSSVS